MMNEIQHAAAEIYRQRQIEAERLAYDRQDSVLAEHPELDALEKQLASLNADTALMILKAVNFESIIKKKEETARQIQDYLAANKIPKDYKLPVYQCEKCKDTGVLGTNLFEKCPCYYDTVRPLLYKYSRFPGIDKSRFDKFNTELFSEEVNEKLYRSRRSPRLQIGAIKRHSETFAEEFGQTEAVSENLFFMGSPGTGKTFMAGAITDALIRKGTAVLYYNSTEMLDLINEYRILMSSYTQEKDRLDRVTRAYGFLLNSPLLIIDDLGTESQNSNRQPDLLSIINHRLANEKKMIITTNLSLNDFQKIYDERLVSRILGRFRLIPFFGPDLRHVLRDI